MGIAKRYSSTRRSLASLILGIVLVATACGSGGSDPIVAGPDDLSHIHDLTFDEDGNLLVASHLGLWRVEGPDRAVLVGAQQHDLMSMTSDIDGSLIAGGHPDLRLDDFRVEDRPPFLGLARSTDGGRSWDVMGLLGEADFHALVPRDGGLYAAGGAGRIWHLDSEGNWTQLGEMLARDLAIDPEDTNRQIAPDYDGGVFVSTDGALTWTPIADAPALTEVEWPQPGEILGMDDEGAVWEATTPEGPWSEIVRGPVGVETFWVDPNGSWWATVEGDAISRSDDRGASWQVVYQPPARD